MSRRCAGLSVVLCAVLCTGLACLLPGAAGAAPPPIDHFTRATEIDDAIVAPSGRRAALLVSNRDGRRQLGVVDLDPVGPLRLVGGFEDADVGAVLWVDDDRLVYTAREPEAEPRAGGAGAFAVDHDGRNPRQLIAWKRSTAPPGSGIASRVLPWNWMLHSPGPDGSGDLFVAERMFDNKGELDRVRLARMNTRSGELRTLSLDMPDGVLRWWLDARGEPRAVLARRADRVLVHRRAEAGAAWRQVAEFRQLVDPGFLPWHAEVDGRLLVLARRGDTQALYEFDAARGAPGDEPLVAVRGFDLIPEMVIDSRSGRLLGLHFVADRAMSVWFDPALQRVQLGIDAALPGRSNRIYCGRCESAPRFVVNSSSDREPGTWYLFDREKSTLVPIGRERPWLDAAGQGTRSLHRVEAGDGLVLPVYVTRPAQAPADVPLPTVVLVHGGPWVRGGDLGWQASAQFLASRGYLVLQPEFRGSEGYGERLFRAGWLQWGRAMQSDLVDTLRWAARTQGADPARACVLGASYGGYAALMAPIATPGVFRCAASFAGVTDMALMYDATWSDLSEAARTYSMPVLIGPREDSARLEAVSPLRRAGEIKVPVLLGHGRLDRRVPLEHASRFVAAARAAGVVVESVVYDDEGHGFVKPANRADWYARLERFLARSLQEPQTPASSISR